jgi:hypothetical protein
VSILEVNGRNYTPPELLAYWIQEREAVRRLKEHGEPKPWSDDWVFRNTYFCNVHREDDKVTKWIRANYTPEILGEYYDYAIVAARIFNWPETLDGMLFKGGLIPYNSAQMEEFLLQRQEAKEKIWGGAYLITTHGQKMTKVDYCVRLMGQVYQLFSTMNGFLEGDTCAGAHEFYRNIDGLGSFLAAQIIADLKNTEGHVLANAEDWKTFSAPGPGSLRGLAWFFELDRVTPSEYQWRIQEVAKYLNWEHCMQDLQNCLCEFDKYCRVRTGAGRSKRKYHGA